MDVVLGRFDLEVLCTDLEGGFEVWQRSRWSPAGGLDLYTGKQALQARFFGDPANVYRLREIGTNHTIWVDRGPA